MQLADDRGAGAHLVHLPPVGLQLAQLRLQGASFHRSELEGCSFADSDLTSAIFAEVQALRCDFERATLTGAGAEGPVQRMRDERRPLGRAVLTQAEFRACDLALANMEQAEMREANLMEQPLTAAQQQSARLHGAKRHRAENVPLTADPFLSAIDAWYAHQQPGPRQSSYQRPTGVSRYV